MCSSDLVKAAEELRLLPSELAAIPAKVNGLTYLAAPVQATLPARDAAAARVGKEFRPLPAAPAMVIDACRTRRRAAGEKPPVNEVRRAKVIKYCGD